jgi:hypothetical protein
VNCPYCHNPIARWWKTLLHPACRFQTQAAFYAAFDTSPRLNGWVIDPDTGRIAFKVDRAPAWPTKTYTRSTP